MGAGPTGRAVGYHSNRILRRLANVAGGGIRRSTPQEREPLGSDPNPPAAGWPTALRPGTPADTTRQGSSRKAGGGSQRLSRQLRRAILARTRRERRKPQRGSRAAAFPLHRER